MNLRKSISPCRLGLHREDRGEQLVTPKFDTSGSPTMTYYSHIRTHCGRCGRWTPWRSGLTQEVRVPWETIQNSEYA